MNAVTKVLIGTAVVTLVGSSVYGFGNMPTDQVMNGKHATNFEVMAYNFRVNMAGPDLPSVCGKTVSGKDKLGDNVGKFETIDYRTQPSTLPGAIGPAFDLPALKQGKKETDAEFAAALKKRDATASKSLYKAIYDRGCKDSQYTALLGGLLDEFSTTSSFSYADVESTAKDYSKSMSIWDQNWSQMQYRFYSVKAKFDTIPKATPVVMFQKNGTKVQLVQGGTSKVTNIVRLYDNDTLLGTFDLDYGITPVFDTLQGKIPLATGSVVCKYDAGYLSGSTPCKALKKAAKAARIAAENAAALGLPAPTATPAPVATPSATPTIAAG